MRGTVAGAPGREAGARPRSVRSRGVRVVAIGVLAAAMVAASLSTPLDRSAASAAVPDRGAPTFESDYLNGVSGPTPAKSVNLAGTWDFPPVTDTVCTGGGPFGTTTGPMTCVDSPASGQETTIQVPGGGWLKQGWTDLSRAVYSRTIDVPNVGRRPGHPAEFRRDQPPGDASGGRTDRRHAGDLLHDSSVFDISAFVRPGGRHLIEVTVEGRKALVGPDGRYTVPEGASWSDDVAQGIFRSADLEVFPAVHISDTVVRTSVTDRQLSYDVYVTNATARAQDVILGAS